MPHQIKSECEKGGRRGDGAVAFVSWGGGVEIKGATQLSTHTKGGGKLFSGGRARRGRRREKGHGLTNCDSRALLTRGLESVLIKDNGVGRDQKRCPRQFY